MTDQPQPLQTQTQLQDLDAKLQQLHEIIAQQQVEHQQLRETIARQQAQLQAMQARLAIGEPARPAETAAGAADPVADPVTSPKEPLSDASEPRRAKTSRRRLLTTAGAAAAAATVATVALGSGEVAHAATGDNFILGEGNNAEFQTKLYPTTGTTPSPLLLVDNSATTSGYGVEASGGPGGIGVAGDAYGSNIHGPGKGVMGTTDIGMGVHGTASSTGVGGFFSGGRAQLWLLPGSASGAPTTGTHNAGELYLDCAAALWFCVTTGAPGTWVQMTHLAPEATNVSAVTGGAITYLAKPIRLLDTRPSQPALFTPGAPYAGGSTHGLQVAGDSYNSVIVPATAVGAIGNVTVVNPNGGGYLALVPHGAGFSSTAVLAFSAGQVVSNSFNVRLAGGQLDIIIGGSSSTDVILDLFAVVA